MFSWAAVAKIICPCVILQKWWRKSCLLKSLKAIQIPTGRVPCINLSECKIVKNLRCQLWYGNFYRYMSNSVLCLGCPECHSLTRICPLHSPKLSQALAQTESCGAGKYLPFCFFTYAKWTCRYGFTLLFLYIFK